MDEPLSNLDAKLRERMSLEGDGWEGWCAAPGDLTAGDLVTVIVRLG